jgi:hypothetical protein
MGSLFGGNIVEVTLDGFGVLSFELGFRLRFRAGFRGVRKNFVVELILVWRAFLERKGMLGEVEMVEFCLGFVTEEAGDLDEGDGFF